MGTTIATQQEKFGGLLDTIERAAEDYALALSSDQVKGMRLTLAKATAVATIEQALTDELLKSSRSRVDWRIGGSSAEPSSTALGAIDASG